MTCLSPRSAAAGFALLLGAATLAVSAPVDAATTQPAVQHASAASFQQAAMFAPAAAELRSAAQDRQPAATPVPPLPRSSWLIIAGLAVFVGFTQREKLMAFR